MDTQEQRDGLSSSNLCGKDAPKHSRDWAKPVSTKTEDIEYHLLDSMEGGKNTGRTDELRYLPLCSSGARLFVLAPPVPQHPRNPSLCCSESEDSIDGELNSENSLQLRLCFLFQPPVFPIETRCTAHCH